MPYGKTLSPPSFNYVLHKTQSSFSFPEHTAIREPNQYTVQNPQLHQIYGNENLLKSSINQIDETTSISQYSNANPPKRTYGNINLKTDDPIVQPSQRTTSKETNISGLTNLFNRKTESVIPIKKSNFDYKTSSTFLNPNYSNEKNYKFASDSGTIRTTISYKFNQVNKVRNPVDEALKKYEEKLQPLKDQINEIKENLKKCKISD